jgi:AcrR family transcriptional regulator
MIGLGHGKSAESDGDRSAGDREALAHRPRGRPARLSRELVIDAVLAMLEREPDEVLSIARIAREVDAAPAALYRHFESLDEMLDSVLTRVLETNESSLDESASWESQLARWMLGLRGHLLQYPAVIALIGRRGRTSPAWLEASSTLVEILEGAGLNGHDLAAAYLWILEMTVGLVMQEAFMPLPEQLVNARASHDELSERARARFASILSEMKHLDGDALFSFAVDQATTAVALRREASQGA